MEEHAVSDNWLYDRLVDFRNWAYQQPDIGIGDFTLHSAADFLLEAYQVTTVDLGDVTVLQHQRDNLNQLMNAGIGLRQSLQDGADALRAVWDSPMAASYLLAAPSLFSINHDVPQTTMGGMALDSTGYVLTSFQHNAAVHDQWATDNQTLVNTQGEVYGILRDIVISVIVDAAIQWIPIADLAGDAGEVAFLGWRLTRLAELIKTFRSLHQAWQLLIIITVVNAVDPAHPITTGIITDLHTLTLPQSVSIDGSGSSTYAMQGTVTGAQGLPTRYPPTLTEEEIQSISQQLAREFSDMGVSAEDIAAMLRLFGSAEVVRYFLTYAREWGLPYDGNIVALFEQFLAWARDAATGSYSWAEAVVAMYYIAVLGREWVRSENGAWDFTEGDIHWDIKSFWNTSLDDMIASIRSGIAEGEHLIIDTTNMTESEIQQLMQAIQDNGWEQFIEWFPPQ